MVGNQLIDSFVSRVPVDRNLAESLSVRLWGGAFSREPRDSQHREQIEAVRSRAEIFISGVKLTQMTRYVTN